MNRTRRIARQFVLLAALTVVVFSPTSTRLTAQGPPAGLPDLVTMLRATPGCLGVDAARTTSGKQVIFAWFENKKAVLNWYYSEGHQQLIKTLAPGAAQGRKPLADIADESGPILTIASLTMADKSQVTGMQLPVSQIAIELYAPLPGGLAAGGRFAPGSVKVPGLIDVPLAGAAPTR